MTSVRYGSIQVQCTFDFASDDLYRVPTSKKKTEIVELFGRRGRMNKCMELQYRIERIEDVAVVQCSGRMVRGAALDGFRRGIEQLDRLRVLRADAPASVLARRLRAIVETVPTRRSSRGEALALLARLRRPPREDRRARVGPNR